MRTKTPKQILDQAFAIIDNIPRRRRDVKTNIKIDKFILSTAVRYIDAIYLANGVTNRKSIDMKRNNYIFLKGATPANIYTNAKYMIKKDE